MKWILLTAFMMFMVLLSSSKSHEAEESAAQKIAVATDFSVTDLLGVVHHLGQNDRECVRVFVFLSTTCPIANSYLQELDRLNESLPAGVELYGVVSDPFVTRQKAVSHFALMKVKFTVLFDGSGLLSKALKPTHVPEAFVIDRRNQLAYRGAIDNAYVTIGRRRTRVEQHYLNDAVRAAAANQPVLIPSTKPVGCQFPELSSADKTGQVTYARHIAPMLQSRCLNCHREGQVAPFSLASYADALAHSKMLVEVTQRRIMPPWIPGQKSQRKFVGDRRLTERELEMLSEWAADGCPEGDPEDLPPTPEFTDGWQLGPPDLIVRMSEPFTVPADGPDLLQNFVLPVEIPEDKLVAAVEFHPGNRRVVHHAVLFLDDKGQARSLDAATKEPGYSNFGGPGFLPSGALGGWSVGNTARRLPNEMGRYLKKGSDLVVQVHYHPTGREESDQSEVGLYFVNKPLRESLSQPARLVGSIWMANYEMDIPAGEPNYRRSTTYTLPRDVILVGIVPHMHLLGKSMKVTATRPGSPPEVLIDVPDWNYNWQDEYYYERPFELSAGTTLTVEAAFDNSSENPSNPSLPPQRVTWGEETTDEMLFCFFLLTANRPEDLIHTILDNLGHDLKQPRKDVSQYP